MATQDLLAAFAEHWFGRDLNGDGEVSGADLGVMLALWGECLNQPCAPDFNGDGYIDGGDLGLLLGYWGFCPEP